MFKHTYEPGGRQSKLMAGIACLALAGWFGTMWGALGGLPFVLAGLGFVNAWWAQRQRERYDLNRLFTDRPPDEDEPREDTVEGEGAPYCAWCDEAYPPGTYRCGRCRRELG